MAVEYLLGTFAEKYSTWDFYERNSIKTQVTNCPLNPKYGVIFCVTVKLQGGLCRKATRNNIAYLGKRKKGTICPSDPLPAHEKGYVCPLIPDYVVVSVVVPPQTILMKNVNKGTGKKVCWL